MRAVILDNREPKEIQALDYGVPVMVQQLPAGDAWLATDDATVVVERKTLADLLASIADERLFNQAHEMKQVSEWSYVVVTEWPRLVDVFIERDGENSRWLLSRVMGALLTVQELGIGVTWCAMPNEYPSTLRQLAARSRGDAQLRPRRHARLMTQAEAILASLPGIADGRAKAIMEHCVSVADALTFLTTDGGGDIPGIGKETKRLVRQALGCREGFGIWQIPDDQAREIENGR